ncbi:AraC family transcriptional regulator [Flavitalea sp. BT771]|uniref:AraC family transcriptional regulator n=1 Tax=Flavitalea sp. BT771 TaxID=3063329 RepID=UPI0026E40CA0|nr:AraC family transcriptional regulator [Flavitalea sp. BT771]MDO6430820.1 AraC family transcriptional regulator [Flavitalea sp. BT771]MDV6219040.1 AraC family transcriptional regulator [Flavitalea sp. BT771]
MVKDHLREPFELVLRELMDECPRGRHTHSFFELIYIVEGTGRQCINEVEFAYKPGDLFLVAPNDTHVFKIEQTSRFFFIRFNHVFVQSSKKDQELAARLEMILPNARHEPGCILKKEADRRAVTHLMEMIIHEHLQHDLYHKELIAQLVNTLLVIIARNISQVFPDVIDEASEEKAVDILQYIQTHIYYPDKLRAEAISKYFGISRTYLGRYFKKHAHETLQDYIMRYKLQLVENRLLHSHMRVTEIADEFGFTDKSHLNRMFKKYRGVNPSDFKRSKAQSASSIHTGA